MGGPSGSGSVPMAELHVDPARCPPRLPLCRRSVRPPMVDWVLGRWRHLPAPRRGPSPFYRRTRAARDIRARDHNPRRDTGHGRHVRGDPKPFVLGELAPMAGRGHDHRRLVGSPTRRHGRRSAVSLHYSSRRGLSRPPVWIGVRPVRWKNATFPSAAGFWSVSRPLRFPQGSLPRTRHDLPRFLGTVHSSSRSSVPSGGASVALGRARNARPRRLDRHQNSKKTLKAVTRKLP